MRDAMKTLTLRNLCVILSLVVTMGLSANSQRPGGGPGGPPPGMPGGPGGPNVPGGPSGPGGPGGPPPSGTQGGRGAASNGGNVQFGPVGRWWDDKSVVKSLGLSSEQKKKMDTIFDANKPAIVASYKNFLAQKSKLDAISKDPKADQAATFAAIDAVNQARTDLTKATAQLYLQIRSEMSADQIEKLEKMP
jgi:Spy/CpxP family protein refolding chaperone